MNRIARKAAILVIVLAVLGACGTPGPGMLFDAASKEYKARETAQLNSGVSAFLLKQESTSSLRGLITFNQGIATGYLRRYLVIISGKRASKDSIAYIKENLPIFIDVEADRCDFKMDIDIIDD